VNIRSEDEDKGNLFVMMLQSNTVRTPSFRTLKSSFSENYFKANELRWKDARAMWHEVQGVTERVADYVARMKKLVRNLDFSDDIFHKAIVQGLRPALKNQVI
jgi:hypothetical protein